MEHKEYILVSEKDDKKFVNEVNNKLKEGWMLIGGVATQFMQVPKFDGKGGTNLNIFTQYSQAMSKG